MLEIKNYLWSLFTLIILLRSSKENSPREIQDEGTALVRDVGNCSTPYTVSRPKEPPLPLSLYGFIYCANHDFFWLHMCSPLCKFRCIGSTTYVFLVLCVTNTMTTYKNRKV
jgi:hypothetical protein